MRYKTLFIAFAVVAGSSTAALAETGWNYDVQNINFDLWCQETANLPAARCDQRTPQDESKFESYRVKFEQYELPYLQQQRADLAFDRDVLHNDPVDNPLSQDPLAQQQSPTEQLQTPTP